MQVGSSGVATSVSVHVLMTSEGRDKLFKLVQYSIKALVWALLQPSLLPDGTQPFRDYWAERLLGNCQTVRNGRALFKLGRWVVTLMEFVECVKRLAHLVTQRHLHRQTTTAVALLCIRSCASAIRNFTRDLHHLLAKELFGVRRAMLTPAAGARLQQVATTAWVAIAVIDVVLQTWALRAPEWFPGGTVLRCACGHRDIARLEFPDVDLVAGCPQSRTVDFVDATPPSAMVVRCAECGEAGRIGPEASWPPRLTTLRSPLVFLPSLVRRVRAHALVLARHGNLRERIILLVKALCDLFLALHAAAAPAAAAADPYRGYRSITATLCGLLSASIALRRVALSTPP